MRVRNRSSPKLEELCSMLPPTVVASGWLSVYYDLLLLLSFGGLSQVFRGENASDLVCLSAMGTVLPRD